MPRLVGFGLVLMVVRSMASVRGGSGGHSDRSAVPCQVAVGLAAKEARVDGWVASVLCRLEGLPQLPAKGETLHSKALTRWYLQYEDVSVTELFPDIVYRRSKCLITPRNGINPSK